MKVELHGPYPSLGRAIRSARQARGLSQVQVGAALGVPTYQKGGTRMPPDRASEGQSCPAVSGMEGTKDWTRYLGRLAEALRVQWVRTAEGWGWTEPGAFAEQGVLPLDPPKQLPTQADIVARRLAALDA